MSNIQELSDEQLFSIAGVQPKQPKLEEMSDDDLMNIAQIPVKPSERGADFQRPEEEAQKAIPTALSIPKNIASDSLEVAKGIGSMVAHPIDTVKGAAGLVSGAVENVASDLYGNVPLSERSPNAKMAMDAGETLANHIVDPSKPVTLENIASTVANTAYEHPVSTLSSVMPMKFNPAVKMTEAALKGSVKGTKALSDLGGEIAKFSTAQATGMSRKTISRILSKPEDFSPEIMKSYSTESVGKEVIDTLNSKIDELSETGKSYKPIREAKTSVYLPKNEVDSVLKKHGIGINENNKLIFDKESITTSQADRSALQDWYDTFGRDSDHTSNSFLNARKSLDNMAQWDSAKTDAANVLAMDLRKRLNEVGHKQLPELKALDEKFAGEVSALKQVKKDYFNSDGTLKDGALSKIANLDNQGRENILSRLESIKPGIGEKIKTLNAVKDIEAASGQKVGTYARGAISGYGVATLNPAIIAGTVLTMPKVATQILRGYGKLLNVKDSAINSIIDKFKGVKQPVKMGEFIKNKQEESRKVSGLLPSRPYVMEMPNAIPVGKGSPKYPNALTKEMDMLPEEVVPVKEPQKTGFTMFDHHKNVPAIKKPMTVSEWRAKQRFQTKGKPYTPKEDERIIDAEFVENNTLPKRTKLQIEAPKPVIKMEENRAIKTGFRKSPWKMTKEEFLNSYTLNEFVADMGEKSKQAVSKMKDPKAFKDKFLGDIYDESVKKAKAEGKYIKPKDKNTFNGAVEQRSAAFSRKQPKTMKQKLIEDKTKKPEEPKKTMKQLHEEWKKQKTSVKD
jgi:hypothetical protein